VRTAVTNNRKNEEEEGSFLNQIELFLENEEYSAIV